MPKLNFTDENFAREVEGEMQKPVLVDFWAEWCGPCRVQGPIVDELAEQMGTRAKIGAMEVDAHPRFPQKYDVMSIPTIAIFKKGKVVWQASGVQSKEILVSQIEKAASA